MTEQEMSNGVTIIPKSVEKREEFFSELNNFINLTFEIQAAKDSQKAILERLFDAKDVDLKRGVLTSVFVGSLPNT